MIDEEVRDTLRSLCNYIGYGCLIVSSNDKKESENDEYSAPEFKILRQ